MALQNGDAVDAGKLFIIRDPILIRLQILALGKNILWRSARDNDGFINERPIQTIDKFRHGKPNIGYVAARQNRLECCREVFNSRMRRKVAPD